MKIQAEPKRISDQRLTRLVFEISRHVVGSSSLYYLNSSGTRGMFPPSCPVLTTATSNTYSIHAWILPYWELTQDFDIRKGFLERGHSGWGDFGVLKVQLAKLCQWC
jgi:hypothetical protein